MSDIVARSVCGELESYENLMVELGGALERIGTVIGRLEGNSGEVSVSDSKEPASILARFAADNAGLASLVARATCLASSLETLI